MYLKQFIQQNMQGGGKATPVHCETGDVDSQSQGKKRVRGANWTAAETAKLTAFCCENTEILDAELSGSGRKHGNVTVDMQQGLWKKSQT